VEAGYRLPPAGLYRLADWRPDELQDLAPSDGLFKLFLLPGDILCKDDARRLEVFCNVLTTSPAAAHLLGIKVHLHTILNSDKEKAMWNNVPSILRDWKRYAVAFVRFG
jgi:hypothetical protein